MGDKIAREIAEAPIGLHAKLEWHLGSNHYPPIDKAFIPVAIDAIEMARMGAWKSYVTYPNGVERTVFDTVENLHLEYFLEEG